MTIHFFTKEDELPGCSRQRAFRVVEELNNRGVDAVVHWPSAVLVSTTRWPKKLSLIIAIIRSLAFIKKGDIVFLQRTISNKYFFVIMVAYLTLFRRKMIFDFDDAIYLHDFYKTKKFTQMADAVIVCSQALAAWAGQYNKNVHIIHTSLKFAAYEKFTKDYSLESKPIVIGWVGTAKDHYANLEFFASVLKQLAKKTTIPFVFRLVGVAGHKRTQELFRAISGVQIELIDSLDWNDKESVPRQIQKFDVGVMPLVSTSEWNLARSSFKPLEYMACGVATAVSAIGEITNVIQDGENGYTAKTEGEWVTKLERLLSDKESRATLGKAGQVSVREKYCYEAIIPRLIEIFEAL